jgi:hypothetical protein
MKTNQTNCLTAAIIGETLADESIDEVGRAVKLAMISLYGPDAPSMIGERAILIGKTMEAATKDLEEGAAEGYPNGFLSAYLNKSLNNSLQGNL